MDRTPEGYITPDYYHGLFLSYDMKNSGNVLLPMIREGVDTVLYSMQFVAVPCKFEKNAVATRLFGTEDMSSYMLQIKLDNKMDASQRYQSYHHYKSRIEQLGANKVALIAPCDNRAERNNPGHLLIGAADLEETMKAMLENNLVLGIKGTKGLEQLYQTRWDAFVSKNTPAVLMQ